MFSPKISYAQVSCGQGAACNPGQSCDMSCPSYPNVGECTFGCSGGGGGWTCNYQGVNCAPNTVIDYSIVTNTVCGVGGPGCWTGTAQTSWCGFGEWRGDDCSEHCTTGPHGNESCNTNCAYQYFYCFPSSQCVATYYCRALCGTTAPTGLAYNISNQNLTWIAGTGGQAGTTQRLFVSADPNQITSNCTLNSSPGCVVNNTNATSPYSLSGVISPGTVYYAKVVNYESGTCSTNSSTLTLISSCSFTSSTTNVVLNNSSVFGSSINSNGAITSVTYQSGDSGVASVTSPDTTHPYSTTITGNSVGSTTVTANVYFGATLTCTANATINVLEPDPWWQVMDGDVGTSGDLMSTVPFNQLFSLPGAGGYAGLASYGGGTNLTTDKVSTQGWLAESAVTNQRSYSYDYFANQVPADTVAVINTVDTGDVAASLTDGTAIHDADDYYWYKYDGLLNSGQNLNIPAVDIGDRKVILLVDNAGVNITGDINLTDGQGFFMLISKGNIAVDPTIGGTSAPNLEGIYFTDGIFGDGASDLQLWLRGALVPNSGTSFLRDLGFPPNATVPSEFFEYAPDQIMLFPSVLGTRRINWKEVAP